MQNLLAMVKSVESDQDETDEDETDGFLAELLVLAPHTEGDTAHILTVGSVSIHRYLRNARPGSMGS